MTRDKWTFPDRLSAVEQDNGVPAAAAGSAVHPDWDRQHDDRMRALRRLTHSMANEFSNLFAIVQSNLETLKRRTEPSDQQLRFIEDALEGARRGTVLTRQMQSFDDTASASGSRHGLSVREIIQSVAQLLRRTNPVRLELDASLGEDLVAYCDPKQLEIAVLNLAVNAHEASVPGSEIVLLGSATMLQEGQIAGLSAGGYVTIAVVDRGRSMGSAAPARCAEAHVAARQNGQRAGLGLSTVQGIAARSRGLLRLMGVPGGGTRAEIWLPGGPCRRAERARSLAEQAARKRKLAVLLVDDDSLVRASVRDMVEDLGHRVVQASSGAEALEVLASMPHCDVLITDFAMPGMSGCELAAAVTAQRPSIRTIYCGGTMPDEGNVPSYRLRKPYTQQDVKALLDEMSADLPDMAMPASVLAFRRDRDGGRPG